MNKNNNIKEMQENKIQIFGVDIKAGGRLINIPVYQGDTNITIVDRLYKEYPRAYTNQCREAIKHKVTLQLEKLLTSKNISTKLKQRISQLLKKSQIGIKIIIKEQDEKKSTVKNGTSKIKTMKKSNSNKNKQNNQRSLQKSFTKFYQIKKNLEEKKAPQLRGQNQQNIIKMFEARERNRKNKDKKLHIYKQDINVRENENQSQILKSIEEKLKNYEKFNKAKANPQNNICLSTQIIMNVTQPLQQKKKQSRIVNQKQSEKNCLSNSKSRFKYNYDEIISERKMAESSKKQNYSYRRKYSQQSNCQFSRCYDTLQGSLRRNYKQLNKNQNQKYTYSIQEQFSKSFNGSQIKENSETYDKQNKLKYAQLYGKSQSKYNLRASTVFRAGDSKQLRQSFKQQLPKKFKYL